jgi:hypothetical protein
MLINAPTELERGLARDEREVANTREPVRPLRQRKHRRWRLRPDGVVALLGLVLAFIGTPALDTQVQVAGPSELRDASAKNLQSPAPAPKDPACAPPPEWGVTEKFAKWRAHRSCSRGLDTLVVEAGADTGESGGFAFLCDKDGVGGRLVLNDNKINIGDAVSLTFTGNPAPALALEAFGPVIELETSDATKRFAS